jgi:GTP-binding protein
VRNVGGRVRFLGSFAEEIPVVGLPEVAFAGRSNVGKSSALNCIAGVKSAARVSAAPGRTQRLNLFVISEAVVFCDLPGYGFAKVPVAVQDAWKGLVEGYLTTREALRLVVVLVDGRHPPQAMDGQLLYALTEARIPRVVLATKVDKMSRGERDKALGALRREWRLKEDLIPFSSVTREGFDATWDAIEGACAP